MRSLVEKFDHRRPVVESDAADKIMDVVAVKSARGGQDNIIMSTGDEVAGQHGLWGLAFPLVFGNELEEVMADIEDSRRRPVLDRDGHASLGGDQADITDRLLTERFRVTAEIGLHRPAHPVGEKVELRPIVTWQETAGSLDDLLQPAGCPPPPEPDRKRQRTTDLRRYLPFGCQAAVVKVANE